MKQGCATALPSRGTAALCHSREAPPVARHAAGNLLGPRRSGHMVSISYKGKRRQMHMRLVRTAARTAAAGAGAVVVLGLASAQAAMAVPPPVVNVPCSATVLATDIAGSVSGETLNLATFCVYKLDSALPEISQDLTIQNNQGTIERSYFADTPDFSIFTVTSGHLVLNQVNLRNGDSQGGGISPPADNSGNGGAIYNNGGDVTVNGGTLSGNTAANLGGAIFSQNGDLTVNGAVFTGNQADDGGAIATLPSDPATVTGSQFSGNSAV